MKPAVSRRLVIRRDGSAVSVAASAATVPINNTANNTQQNLALVSCDRTMSNRTETIAEGVTLHLGDCREILPSLGRFDAIVTDPPYGIGADEAAHKNKGKWGWKFYGETSWDKSRPAASAIILLREISDYQIIWGGNYFTDLLPPTMQWLIWDKGQRDFSLADFEIAWSSQHAAGRIIDYPRSLALKDGKEHPTQKPIEVMAWSIQALPESCVSICDPFMGAGTTGVAAVRLGKRFTGIEIDSKYFDIACRRIDEEWRKPRMFVDQPKPAEQLDWAEMWTKPFDKPELVWGENSKPDAND
jgi:DNA modification methylase